MNQFRNLVVTAALMLTPLSQSFATEAISTNAPLRYRIGGGNIVTHLTGAPTAQLYSALRGVGAKLGRMDSYGWRDLDRKPIPGNFDAAMLEAHRQGITPVILLEYEGSYQTLQPPQPTGSYDDWFAAGQAFAKRFRPNGEWALENGIVNWGAEVFTAINEPDVQATIPREVYRDALAGLADGVHSIDRALRVVPGGFATCNSHGDATLRGYGPAISALLEDGRLDGIDLHTYYNAKWYPLTRGRDFSAQTCFDRIKAAMSLKRDINFYATEFNIARDGEWEDPRLAARLFLTAFWDNVGVVKSDGRTSATMLAFPWNLADTGSIEGPAYAMAASEAPWRPDPRAKVLRTVLQIAGDMKLTSLDPKAGKYTLEGDAGQLLVWQNLPGWTDKPGLVWEIQLPDWARDAELWAWDGKRREIRVNGDKAVITGLSGNETYMLRVMRRRP
ncbi:MAG: hypothetical protein JWR49_3546 [Tardiphaga sp.]|nr:hypothetical protein [Tardiphaga sp.]